MALYVINSSGDKELFSFRKIYRSARAVGASERLAQKIAQTVKKRAYPNIKTSEIANRVKKLLQGETPEAALRFNLKEGMRKLGPTGFPFEKFIGEIFKAMGFEVKTNQYLAGHCLKGHEIDFLASKGNLIYLGECKYHNFSGEKVSSKDALANFARFVDILNGPFFQSKKYSAFKIKALMATNTKFTARSIDYLNCMGVELLGWKCPKNAGLETLIEKEKLYPVTMLPSLSNNLKNIFVSEKIMLVRDVLKIDSQRFASKFRIQEKQLHSLIKEARILIES